MILASFCFRLFLALMTVLGSLAATTCALAADLAQSPAPRLKVSDNGHFLVRANGAPFFYLADTAWELIHRLTREDAEFYLKRRAEQGYTVIQTVVLAEFDGLDVPNAYGEIPLKDHDPLQPNERYFAHVDWVVRQAESHGLTVALLPTWGDKWNKKWGKGPEIFTSENAAAYGEWIGRRYADRDVIWILGGDRPVENDRHRMIVEAMAQGVRKGDGGARLITYHPSGGAGSAQYFHHASWLDFNIRQNGHGNTYTNRYSKTLDDYHRTPVKPVLDAEPVYEGHPLNFKPEEFGHSLAADVRRALYWDLFSGACGHTYGHHSIWQFLTPDREPVNKPLMPWREALEQPGANQMQYGRRLIESRPILTRIPDDTVIVPASVPTSVPGAGTYRFVATRDSAGSYAMVYVPVGRSFSVKLSKLAATRIKAWWYDPRTGHATVIGEFANEGDREFTPPTPGELLDWVLVLDDAAKGYPTPGSKK